MMSRGGELMCHHTMPVFYRREHDGQVPLKPLHRLEPSVMPLQDEMKLTQMGSFSS